jgi:hypothetical protein
VHNQIVLELPEQPALEQLAWALDEIARAVQRLDDQAAQQFTAYVGRIHEQLAAEIQRRASTGARHSAEARRAAPLVEPLAVTPRKAAELIGVGHPLFYKEVMPFVASGAILSCQLGHHRVILLASLREWMEKTARASSCQPASG